MDKEKVNCSTCDWCSIIGPLDDPWLSCKFIDHMEKVLGLDREQWPANIEICFFTEGSRINCAQYRPKR
jgi:hypothetical protein